MLKPKKSRAKRGVQQPARAVIVDLDALRAVPPRVAAGVLRLPSSTFRRYVCTGILPKPSRHGVHDLVDLIGAWIDYVAADRSKDPDIAQAKLRYWRARASREELELEARAGELIPVAVAHQIIVDALSIVRTQTDAIAGRLAMEVAAMTDPAIVRRTLLDEHRRIHRQASEQLARLYGTANGSGEPGGADTEAAADDTS